MSAPAAEKFKKDHPSFGWKNGKVRSNNETGHALRGNNE